VELTSGISAVLTWNSRTRPKAASDERSSKISRVSPAISRYPSTLTNHVKSGVHHSTKPGSKKSEELTTILVISSVSSSLKAPVCKTSVQLDVRSQYIRTAESAAANWFADIVQHAYDGTLAACPSGKKTVDMVFICAGMLRGDSVYGPGDITLGDILEILPFEDPLVVIEVDGETIWKALEAGLSTWPAQEGRFPVISGVRVEWDSKGKPGERVRSVKIVKEGGEDGEEVKKDGSGKYIVLTREYMAQVSVASCARNIDLI
jgi:5'-nucleotidase